MRNSLQDSRYRAVITRLVAIRDELDINQRELARRLGRSRSFVGKVETFEHRLDPVQLVDWLRALGVSERKFLLAMLADIPEPKAKK